MTKPEPWEKVGGDGLTDAQRRSLQEQLAAAEPGSVIMLPGRVDEVEVTFSYVESGEKKS